MRITLYIHMSGMSSLQVALVELSQEVSTRFLSLFEVSHYVCLLFHNFAVSSSSILP